MLEQAYREAWNDTAVRQAYGDGKNGDLRGKGAHNKPREYDDEPSLTIEDIPFDTHPKLSSDAGSVEQSRDLLAIHFDARGIDVRLLRILVRNIEHGGEAQWQLRENDLKEAEVPDGFRALLTLDMLANEARSLIRSLLREYQPLDPSMPPDYVSADKAREAYRDKLLSAREPKISHRAQDRNLDIAIRRGFNLAYLKGVEERLSDIVNERAQNLYGEENAEEMMDLWRVVNYLRSSKFSQGDVTEFRRSVYGALKEKNVQKARDLIRKRIVRTPDAFTPAAHRILEVTQAELSEVRVQRGDTRKMTPEEKKVHDERKRQENTTEILQPIRPYVGKTLYDAKGDRLIYCIGLGAIERKRASYDSKTRQYKETSSKIPAMEVRYFSRPKSGGTAKARKESGFIKPAEFLVNVENGTYTLREDIALSPDATEITTNFFPEKK